MTDAGQTAPHRLEFDLREYWNIVWRWKWLALVVFLVVSLSVAWYVERQVPVYESSVAVRLSAREPMAMMEGTRLSWFGPSRKLDTQIKLITENDKLHRRARESLLAGLPADSPWRVLVESEEEFYPGKLRAEQLEQSDIITVTVAAPDPQLTKYAVQALAETYVQWFIEEATQEVKNTRDFVQERLQEQEKDLRAVEDQVSAFERQHPGVGTASVYRDRLAALEVSLTEILELYSERHPQVVKLRQEMAKLKAALEQLPEVDLGHDRLVRQRQQLRTLVGALNEQFLQRDIAYKSKVEESLQEVTIIRAASEPTPQGASPLLTTLLGALVGLIVGLGAALAAHALDSSLATVEGVEELTGLPVLGEIPYLRLRTRGRGWRFRLKAKFWPGWWRERERLVIKFPLASQGADAYKSTRKQLLDQLPERGDAGGHVVLVTSAAPREGKTLTALNLALIMGQTGMRVLYLEADLRRPAAAHLLGVGSRAAGGRGAAPGLTDILVGAASFQDCRVGLADLLLGELGWDELVTVPGIDNVDFVFSGTRVRNPAEVLVAEELTRLFLELRQRYDIVLVDCAPAFPVPDPAIIGPLTDGACLVYNIGITSRQILVRATHLLAGSSRDRPAGQGGPVGGEPERSETPSPRRRTRLLGIVLNQIRPDVQLKHYYYYRYYGDA
ncbi:MAG: hypothetical protein KAX80_11245 [Planctomycetes bacterium]|nr:hypothetical protein [Planctomycetota bacterium]